ncbi:unnamed protein product [Gadus morhua 'NCC']
MTVVRAPDAGPEDVYVHGPTRHGVHQGSLEEPFRQLADVTRFHLTKTTSSQTYDRSKPRDGPLACSAHHLDSLNLSLPSAVSDKVEPHLPTCLH